MTLAELIRTHRERLGMSQPAYAAHLGISAAFVQKLEYGERTIKDEAMVLRIADRLGISSDDLYASMRQAPPDLVAALTTPANVATTRRALGIPAPA